MKTSIFWVKLFSVASTLSGETGRRHENRWQYSHRASEQGFMSQPFAMVWTGMWKYVTRSGTPKSSNQVIHFRETKKPHRLIIGCKKMRDTARWMTGITWLHGNQGLWVGSDWWATKKCPSIAKKYLWNFHEFPFDLLCFTGSGLWRSGSIFGMLQLGSVGDSQLGSAGGVERGRMGVPNFGRSHPTTTRTKKLGVFPSERSQTSNSRILQESKVLWFLASQLPTQAENLELLHSEPRILRVLLEVGPYFFSPWNVDEGKDERS